MTEILKYSFLQMFHLDPLTHTIFNPELFSSEMPLATGKKTSLLPCHFTFSLKIQDLLTASFRKPTMYLERKW